jgi:signal transduction histidine kinase
VRRPTVEQTDYLPAQRAERFIAAGRLLLAVFLVLAIERDPTIPLRYADILRRFSIAYLAYAALVALLTGTRRTPLRQLPLVTHIVDLVLFSALMHVSAAPTSPFFVYLIFAMVCGALRWHGLGALLTGGAALIAYIALTAAGRMSVLVPDEFEQTRFITRCTQLVVITGLVAYLGSYQRRLRVEIASLAAWPRRLPADESTAVRDVLTHAAAILRVSRIILTWQEGEEPSLRVAVSDHDAFELRRERPDAFGALVAEPLQHSSFFCSDASARSCFVVFRVPGGFDSFRGQPLDRAFCDRYRVRSVLALRIATDTIEGRLIALDRRSLAVDDILLGDIVGRLVASALEQQALITQLRDAAVTEERLRLARELHDGVLQSLTAVGMQIDRLRALLDPHSTEAHHRLAVVEDAIATEHRSLRQLLDDLHPGRAGGRARIRPLGRLREITSRLERQWDVQVQCDVGREVPALSAGLLHELSRMTEEAIVNAVRHGGAREVRVELESTADHRLRLGVSYRGRGFAGLRGRHDLASLKQHETGPRTLKERVAALGGDLVIESGDSGAKVEILVSADAQLGG